MYDHTANTGPGFSHDDTDELLRQDGKIFALDQGVDLQAMAKEADYAHVFSNTVQGRLIGVSFGFDPADDSREVPDEYTYLVIRTDKAFVYSCGDVSVTGDCIRTKHDLPESAMA